MQTLANFAFAKKVHAKINLAKVNFFKVTFYFNSNIFTLFDKLLFNLKVH